MEVEVVVVVVPPPLLTPYLLSLLLPTSNPSLPNLPPLLHSHLPLPHPAIHSYPSPPLPSSLSPSPELCLLYFLAFHLFRLRTLLS